MGTLRIIFLIALCLFVIIFVAINSRKRLRDEISLAERRVKEFLGLKNYEIISFSSKQKEIKVKGFHVGIKIKAIVVNNEGNKVEMIMIHNAITDNIIIISQNIVDQ